MPGIDFFGDYAHIIPLAVQPISVYVVYYFARRRLHNNSVQIFLAAPAALWASYGTPHFIVIPPDVKFYCAVAGAVANIPAMPGQYMRVLLVNVDFKPAAEFYCHAPLFLASAISAAISSSVGQAPLSGLLPAWWLVSSGECQPGNWWSTNQPQTR